MRITAWPKPLLLLALALTLAACGDGDATGPDPIPDDSTDTTPPPRVAVELPVLGRGPVTDRYTAEIAVAGNHAYTTTWGSRGGRVGNAVKIWDVSGGAPVLVDSIIVPQATTTSDVQISDDGRLLVVSTERTPGSIVVFDRTIPTRPVQLSRFTSANTNPGVHTVKLGRVAGRHYAFLSVDPAGTFAARLVIVDITDPAAPTEVFSRVMGQPFIHDVFVRDGVLFTANWDAGLTLWDIGGGGAGGTPAAPIELGTVATVGGDVHNVWWYHDAAGRKRYAFVGEEGPASCGSFLACATGDIHVVDVADMRNPREVAFYHVPTGGPEGNEAGTHNFTVDETRGILYAAYYNAGVRALDVTGDLGSCSAAEKAPDGRCDLALMKREIGFSPRSEPFYIWGVARSGTRLFASDMLAGLVVFDLATLYR